MDRTSNNSPGGTPTPAQAAELVATHYSGLLNLLRRKLKDRELANDLVNEAIAITLEHSRQGRLTGQQNIAGYVFKVSMNLLLNYRRNSDNRPALRADAGALELLSRYDQDGVQAAQVRAQTLAVIAALNSPRDREVIKRFYLNEDDRDAICRELGLTSLQFTQVIARARQRMKTLFTAKGLSQRDLYCVL